MAEVGEQIVGGYLSAVEGCDLVEYNIPLRDAEGKGEIDVVGINLKKKTAYFCEVTTHTGGMQYVRGKRPANVPVLTAKFEKDIAYAKKYFSGFKKVFMYWSPIVKATGEQSKYKPFDDLKAVHDHIKKKLGVEIRMIYNQEYLDHLNRLKDYASRLGEKSNNFPIRFLQIQGKLERYCALLKKKSQVG